jgi:hypothetical protein
LGCLELEQFLPNVVGKIWIMVGDNKVRHAMEFEFIIHENFSHYVCGECVLEET